MENKLALTQLKQLKKMLIGHGNYSLSELKDSLLIQSNSELLCLLEKNLSKEISAISYVRCASDYRWLANSLKYVIEIITKDANTHTLDHYEIIDKIKQIVIKKQTEARSSIPRNLKNFYEDILDVLNTLVTFLAEKTKSERKKQKEKQDSYNLYHFAELLIYKYQNFDYFYQIAKTYPALINSVNEKNVPLLNALIRRQVKNLKHSKGVENDKIVYFSRIINFIINSNHLKLTNKQSHEILTYLKSELFYLEHQGIMEMTLYAFLVDTISDLKTVLKNMGVTRDVRELYKKFSIKEINDVYYPNIVIPNMQVLAVEDYTDKNIITMDFSQYIRFYDDAISCEILDNSNYLVGVYIPDLTEIILPETELDFTTYERCETIYLDDKAIDMLPNIITSNYSLNRGVNRKVMAFMFEFTPDAYLYDFKVKNAVINVKANLTFNSAQKLYHVNHNNEYGKVIKNLIKLNHNLQESKFYNSNYHILKEQKRKMEDLQEYHVNNDCGRVVSALMILVNSAIAKFFADNGYPFLYRNNLCNVDEGLIEKIKNSPSTNALPQDVHKLIDKVYTRSSYSSINIGHHGLGLGYYCHITNPLRSYASIITQRLAKQEFINGGLRDQDLKYYEEILPQIASSINKTIDTHNVFVEEYNKIKKKNKF